ncbi:MAG TPA: hypothetical protein VGH65_04615 [Verrucomicrobiaceae bacterium]|jgi:hypothetical protein
MDFPQTKKWIWWLPLALAWLPAWMAWQDTCLVPHSDHWPVVALPWFRWLDGAPLWKVLHERYNDSRHDIPRLLHFALLRFGRWNLQVESLLCVFITAGTVAQVILWFRRLQPGGNWRAWVASLMASSLILSPHAWMNWTFGVQLCYALVVFFTVLVLTLFQSNLPLAWRALFAGISAAAATHSFLNGWLAWLLGSLGLLQAALQEKAPQRKVVVAVAVWLSMLALTAAVFFPGFMEAGAASGEIHSSFARIASTLWPALQYFILLLGAPLAEGWPTSNRETRHELTVQLAPVVASLLLLLFVGVLIAIVRQRRWEKGRVVFPFLALSLWGLANAAAIALGRVGVSASDAFQSRYLAYTIWFHVGLLALICVPEGSFWRWTRGIMSALLIYAHGVGVIQGWRDAGRDHDRNQLMVAACVMRHVAPEPTLLDNVWPLMGLQIVPMLDRLESLGLLHVATVRRESPDRGDLSQSSFGTLEEGRWLEHGVVLRGWALKLPSRNMVDAVVVSMQQDGVAETWLGVAQRRVIRAKPARKFHAVASEERIGWEYTTPSGLERSMFTSVLILIRAKPIPSGMVTFRAYALDLKLESFSLLEGEFTAQIP